MEKEMGRLRSRALTIYHHHDFLIIMVTVITLLVLAIWAAKADNADAGNLPERIDEELTLKTWNQIIKVSPDEQAAKIKIFQAVKFFAEERIRWSEGIEDKDKIYLHPMEIQNAARLLERSAVHFASTLYSEGEISLSEYKIFLKKYSFHFNEVKRIAGVEE